MGTLLLLFCLCFAALLTPPMLSKAQAHEDEIKPPPGRPAEDLKTPEMQYFINIAPQPPVKPCNPSSHNQVVIFWVVMPLIICNLPTDNSPVMPSDNFHANQPPISFLPSAPPLEVLACQRCGYPDCNILPSQFVCPYCGNMWPVNVYAV